MVFPEGARGITKLWPQRYQLQEFGLGFMRLALETDTPIVPVAVIGAEEQAPAFLDLKPVAKLLGFPALPDHAHRAPVPAAHQVPHLLRRADALHRARRTTRTPSWTRRCAAVKTAIQAHAQPGAQGAEATSSGERAE